MATRIVAKAAKPNRTKVVDKAKAKKTTKPIDAGQQDRPQVDTKGDLRAQAKFDAKAKAKAKEQAAAEYQADKAAHDTRVRFKKGSEPKKRADNKARTSSGHTRGELYRRAKDQADAWEALVYGALALDKRGRIQFVDQWEDQHGKPRGGKPKRKQSGADLIDQLWQDMPQEVRVKALSSYSVYKYHFIDAVQRHGLILDMAHIYTHFCKPAGVTGFGLYQVFAFMLDYNADARNALIWTREFKVKPWIDLPSYGVCIRRAKMQAFMRLQNRMRQEFEWGKKPVSRREVVAYDRWLLEARAKKVIA